VTPAERHRWASTVAGMAELVPLDEFPDYADAAVRARQLSSIHAVETAIRRSGSTSTVLVPAWVKFNVVSEAREAGQHASEPSEPETCMLCGGFGHSPWAAHALAASGRALSSNSLS
jgi:hypothetical protein